MVLVTIIAFGIMLASLAGALFANRTLGSWMDRHLHFLPSFAAGIFVVVAFDLVGEAFSEVGYFALGGVIFGAAIFYLIARTLPESHHHHDRERCGETHGLGGARRILIADAVHNVADGIVLAPAFLADFQLGIVVSASIFVHELVQEVSEFFVLREAGMSTRRALGWNFVVSATILIGVAIGALAARTAVILGIILSLAAGAFFYVVCKDLIPHSLITRAHPKGHAARHVTWLLLGVALMLFVGSLTAGRG